MEGLISPALAAALPAARLKLNRLFRDYGRAVADPDAFLLFYGQTADAWIQGAAPAQTEITAALESIMLALLMLNLDTASADTPEQRVILGVTRAYPRACLPDALPFYRMALTAYGRVLARGEKRAITWMEKITKAGGGEAGLENFKNAGIAAAWSCGLVRYRNAALEALAGLDAACFKTLLGFETGMDKNTSIQVLGSGRWAQNPENPEAVTLASCGGAALLGGVFRQHPVLKVKDGLPVVLDGEREYFPAADRMGMELLEAIPDSGEDVKPAESEEFSIAAGGVTAAGRKITFGNIMPMPGAPKAEHLFMLKPVSAVKYGSTVFFTLNDSYGLYALGFPGADA